MIFTQESAVLTNTRSLNGQTSLLAVTGLLDIEEDIWSPTYGIKGKLDASVTATVEDIERSDNPFRKAVWPTTKTVTSHKFPFEIKTGRAVAGMEHRAQTMLYTLLMSERYESDIPSGLLYYTQSEEVVRVPAARNEIRGLMMARNEMAEYMTRRMTNVRSALPKEDGPDICDVEDCAVPEAFLPPTIDDVRTCGKCFVVDTCMLYRRAVENVVDDSSPIRDIYELKTSHLTTTQAAFFKKWESLVSLEEQELVRFKKELWTMGAAEREAKGRCFANMMLDTTYNPPSPSQDVNRYEGKIHQYTFQFTKMSGAIGEESLLNGHMSVGDAVTVSVEPDLLALARGFILELSPEEIVIGVDHDLSAQSIRLRRPNASDTEPVYRIDKDEFSGGMSRIRDNLAQLFYPDGDARRLELVVDLKEPVFDRLEGPIISAHEPLAQLVDKLNADQQEAMRMVLGARDYGLILGMPGTGKTTVVAAIIKALVCLGKSVLLTSYTHSAVDTILLKLKDQKDFGILRLGNIDKVRKVRFMLSALFSRFAV